MRHHDTTARYSLELDMIERDRSTGAALLRSEFGLALNASHFMALSAGDIQVGEIERSHPSSMLFAGGGAQHRLRATARTTTPRAAPSHRHALDRGARDPRGAR